MSKWISAAYKKFPTFQSYMKLENVYCSGHIGICNEVRIMRPLILTLTRGVRWGFKSCRIWYCVAEWLQTFRKVRGSLISNTECNSNTILRNVEKTLSKRQSITSHKTCILNCTAVITSTLASFYTHGTGSQNKYVKVKQSLLQAWTGS